MFSLHFSIVDDHRICCNFDSMDQCIILNKQPPLFQCGRLIRNMIFRVLIYALGGSAILGNIVCLIQIHCHKTQSTVHTVQSIMMGNHALADFLMGAYLGIIAVADFYFGNEYHVHSDSWRYGIPCRVAGFLFLFSTEASIFFLTLISFDRFMGAVCPSSNLRYTILSARLSCMILWLISIAVGVVPIVFASPESPFYALSDTCIALPIITIPEMYELTDISIGEHMTFTIPVTQELRPAWYLSLGIIGLNLFCFLCVCFFYLVVLFKCNKQQDRNKDAVDERQLAMEKVLVILINFISWMTIIVMVILSQFGIVVIPYQIYIWTVVLILPINAAINPYLRAISYVCAGRKQRMQVHPSEGDARNHGNDTVAEAGGSNESNA